MSFWSTQTTRTRLTDSIMISEPIKISQGALQLRLGSQVAISDDDPKILKLDDREEVKIPPGQVALLLTEEILNMPHNALGLISLKTKIKSQGLINISGFHVDPGYKGRLKFWVYNAGKLPVIMKRGDYCFSLWFSDFDASVTDPYENKSGQDEITSEDLNKMRGTLDSPAALSNKLRELEQELATIKRIGAVVVTALVAWIVKFAFDELAKPKPIQAVPIYNSSSPTPVQSATVQPSQ